MDGSGGFGTISNLFQIPSGTPSGMTVGDLDWDDDNDLIITAINPDRIYVYANNGTGVFSLAQTITTDNDPAFPTLVDVTLEYYPWTSHMLVVANMSSSRYGYQVYTKFMSTSFTYRFGSDLLIQGSRGKPFGIFLTDIDGDEDYDIVIPVICTGSYDLIVARNNDYNNEGKWTFANKREMDINRKNLLNALKPNAVHGTNFNLGYNT